MVTSQHNFKSLTIWILLLSILIVQLLICTWYRVQCRQVGYNISKETHTYKKLIAVQNTLKIELERLRSPKRISRIAQYDLGLITPAPSQKKNIPAYDTAD